MLAHYVTKPRVRRMQRPRDFRGRQPYQMSRRSKHRQTVIAWVKGLKLWGVQRPREFRDRQPYQMPRKSKHCKTVIAWVVGLKLMAEAKPKLPVFLIILQTLRGLGRSCSSVGIQLRSASRNSRDIGPSSTMSG
jgi:hypothetical protein